MKTNEWKNLWKLEEEKTFAGWDFSYIDGRSEFQAEPWDYKATVLSYIHSSTTLLDMGTGGGEFLLSLSPPKGSTYATEAYLPNYELCKRTLPAHGIEVRRVIDDNELPYEDNFFDLVINRHEAYSVEEVRRILKPNGIFVTQQVGGLNNKELSTFLLGKTPEIVDQKFDLASSSKELSKAGFTIMDSREYFPRLKFFDVGALVYFAKIIEWEFPDFTVEKHFDKLCLLQAQVEQKGYVESMEHRFFLIARKCG
ncbi:class I SAM-dependent methyltransferase [Paenibacillus sp. CAU 1523]|uniref:Class I SAM-dependent methyltransferase n=2 Tax=Paenibacillus arenosi TaxID=2774142 RepID=A0ABR9AV75_9BACL|nr:class I SAM-dependent methyltransferase [Paenibacillus arenosi]